MSSKKVFDKMTPKEKRFCDLYVSKDYMGNGVQAYAEAFNKDLTDPKQYNSSRTNASKLLTNTNILLYINELLDTIGFNDAFVDKQLLFTMTQNADFGSKVAAIKEYNKLKQRITEKIQVTNYDVTITTEETDIQEAEADDLPESDT